MYLWQAAFLLVSLIQAGNTKKKPLDDNPQKVELRKRGRCNIRVVDVTSKHKRSIGSIAESLRATKEPILLKGFIKHSNLTFGRAACHAHDELSSECLKNSRRNSSGTANDEIDDFLDIYGNSTVAVGLGTTLSKYGPEFGLEIAAFDRQSEVMLQRTLDAVTPRVQVPSMTANDFVLLMRNTSLLSEDAYCFFNITGSSLERELVASPSIDKLWSKVVQLKHSSMAKTLIWDLRATRLAIGPIGSGLTFHTHQEALNGLLIGKKRWYIFDAKNPQTPVGILLKSTTGDAMSTQQWLNATYSRQEIQKTWKKHAWECAQSPGDVMFVPAGLHHAVLNEEESVAVAITNDASRGESPIMKLAKNGELARVREELKENPWYWKQKDILGRNAMHYAAIGGHAAVIKLLIERGMPFDARDAQGNNIADIARINGHDKLARQLEKKLNRLGKGGAEL